MHRLRFDRPGDAPAPDVHFLKASASASSVSSFAVVALAVLHRRLQHDAWLPGVVQGDPCCHHVPALCLLFCLPCEAKQLPKRFLQVGSPSLQLLCLPAPSQPQLPPRPAKASSTLQRPHHQHPQVPAGMPPKQPAARHRVPGAPAALPASFQAPEVLQRLWLSVRVFDAASADPHQRWQPVELPLPGPLFDLRLSFQKSISAELWLEILPSQWLAWSLCPPGRSARLLGASEALPRRSLRTLFHLLQDRPQRHLAALAFPAPKMPRSLAPQAALQALAYHLFSDGAGAEVVGYSAPLQRRWPSSRPLPAKHVGRHQGLPSFHS
mmetsp:Transcript_58376/g.103798  ORF Transcript_58376/g.103798 Transcript_58376/m.103798 type:complete len:324 (-) Transcript_58376:445-1416(-)